MPLAPLLCVGSRPNPHSVGRVANRPPGGPGEGVAPGVAKNGPMSAIWGLNPDPGNTPSQDPLSNMQRHPETP